MFSSNKISHRLGSNSTGGDALLKSEYTGTNYMDVGPSLIIEDHSLTSILNKSSRRIYWAVHTT